MMTNPLLSSTPLPAFSEIRPEHVEPALNAQLEESRSQIAAITEADGPRTWDNLAAPLEIMQHRLAKLWSPVSHLNGVCNSQALRRTYNTCLPLLTRFHTELAQSRPLYAAFSDLQQQVDPATQPQQYKVVSNSLRDFRLAGVALAGNDKKRFADIMDELATLSARFEENVLDASNAWTCHITDPDRLTGLPEQTRERK